MSLSCMMHHVTGYFVSWTNCWGIAVCRVDSGLMVLFNSGNSLHIERSGYHMPLHNCFVNFSIRNFMKIANISEDFQEQLIATPVKSKDINN